MELTLNGKKISFRKWKVKDRNNFVNAKNKVEQRQALVYNCLADPNTPLDIEEYNYLLMKIRMESIGSEITYNLKCPKCGKLYTAVVDLKDLIEYKESSLSRIEVGDTVIELQGIRKKDIYENTINSIEDNYIKYIYDFAFHVKSINDNSVLTFEYVLDFINNLDVDVFEEIFKQWEAQRFKISMNGYLECEHCHENTLYNFDDLPNFFPKSWRL